MMTTTLADILGTDATRTTRPTARWIGRCKCGIKRKVEGAVHVNASGVHAVVATDGTVHRTDFALYDDRVRVRCTCGRWCVLELVVEGTKESKHVCGARCTNAVGPSCDCRCRGANHGRSL